MIPNLQARLFEATVPLTEMTTTCLLLDESRLERNAARLAAHWKDSSVCLRPHLKTCRCWEVARRILPSATSPCTVATMGEAEAVASLGARDIVLAVGIRPSLFARARALSLAAEDARSKAEVISGSLGCSLGQVVDVSYGSRGRYCDEREFLSADFNTVALMGSCLDMDVDPEDHSFSEEITAVWMIE